MHFDMWVLLFFKVEIQLPNLDYVGFTKRILCFDLSRRMFFTKVVYQHDELKDVNSCFTLLHSGDLEVMHEKGAKRSGIQPLNISIQSALVSIIFVSQYHRLQPLYRVTNENLMGCTAEVFVA